MSYRNEWEILRTRVNELEEENVQLAAALRGYADPVANKRGLRERIYGGPLEVTACQTVTVVAGDVPSEEATEALSEIYGTAGLVNQVGRRLTWAAYAQSSHIEYTLTTRAGKLTVRAREELTMLASSAFSMLALSVIVATAFVGIAIKHHLGMPWLWWMSWTVVVVMSTALARAIYGRFSRRRSRQLAARVQRVARAAEAVEPQIGSYCPISAA